MSTQFPQPPNPWDTDVWLEMTRSTLWLVGPWGRCILEAGDDAWPDGKLGGRDCGAQIEEVFAAIAPPSTHPATPAIAAVRVSGNSGSVPIPGAPGTPFLSGTDASAPIEPLVILDSGKHVTEEFPDAVAIVPLPMTAMLLICAILAVRVLTAFRSRAACL